ncbi:MAG: ABC transporter substrate-binding protein [Anaerolineae bacterium]|nr:ABC transporter substrate-binding protein [Anaerolineae bacterium]
MAATMAGTETAGGFDPAVCFRAAPSNDKEVSYPAKTGPFKIGISNSFIGNAWRTQMIQMAKAYAETPEIKAMIKELTVVSSGQDVEAQIAQMDNMIASGVDAIILNAATPEAFNAVIKRAADAGVIVVSFDNVVTAPQAVLVNEDQVEFGRVMAEDLVKRMGGKGNVVMVNGVPGTSVDSDRQKGAKDVFAKNPDIKVIAELEGQWDSGKAQTVMANLLATKPKIDGVWIQGGGPGVLQAFKDAKYPFVPMAGEAENGFRKALAENKDKGLVGISVGQTPGMVAVSMRVAIELLQGRKMPRVIAMPLPIATTEDLKEGVTYFANLPDDFFTPIKIPACGVNLTPEAILAVKVQ